MAENWDDMDTGIHFLPYENTTIISCSYCYKYFNTMEGLQMHKKVKHGICELHCEICFMKNMEKKFFNTRQLYQQHQLSHHKK